MFRRAHQQTVYMHADRLTSLKRALQKAQGPYIHGKDDHPRIVLPVYTSPASIASMPSFRAVSQQDDQHVAIAAAELGLPCRRQPTHV